MLRYTGTCLVFGSVQVDLEPGSVGTDFVFESVVMWLGSWSAWTHLDSRFPRANQALGTSGVGSASRSTKAGLVLA